MGLFNHSIDPLKEKLTGAIEICDIIIKHRRNNPNLDINNLKKAINILKQYLTIISDGFRHRNQDEKSDQLLNHIINCDKLGNKISLPKNEVVTEINKIKIILTNLLEEIKLNERSEIDILKNRRQHTNFTQPLNSHYDH